MYVKKLKDHEIEEIIRAISDEDAAQLYTVGRIVDYLEKLQ